MRVARQSRVVFERLTDGQGPYRLTGVAARRGVRAAQRLLRGQERALGPLRPRGHPAVDRGDGLADALPNILTSGIIVAQRTRQSCRIPQRVEYRAQERRRWRHNVFNDDIREMQGNFLNRSHSER